MILSGLNLLILVPILFVVTFISSGDFLCHLEGMTVIGDSMYLGMNCHQASPKNQIFLVYNGLAAIEQRYQNS